MGCGEFYLGENPPHSFLIPFRHILASRVVEERVAALRDDQFETLALSSPPRQKLDDAPQVNHLLDFDHPMKLHELVWIVFPLIQLMIRPARAITLSSPYRETTPSVSASARIRVLMHQIVILNDRVDPAENRVQVELHVIFRHDQGRRRNWDSKRLRRRIRNECSCQEVSKTQEGNADWEVRLPTPKSPPLSMASAMSEQSPAMQSQTHSQPNTQPLQNFGVGSWVRHNQQNCAWRINPSKLFAQPAFPISGLALHCRVISIATQALCRKFVPTLTQAIYCSLIQCATIRGICSPPMTQIASIW